MHEARKCSLAFKEWALQGDEDVPNENGILWRQGTLHLFLDGWFEVLDLADARTARSVDRSISAPLTLSPKQHCLLTREYK